MTVRENLMTAAQPHISTIAGRLFMSPHLGLDETVDVVLNRFRLGHLADEYAANLSFGQKKLLDTAMAFMSTRKLSFWTSRRAG